MGAETERVLDLLDELEVRRRRQLLD